MNYQILHNPRCSKSRATLALLEAADCDVTVIDYLNEPPSAATLKTIIAALGADPAVLVRAKEARELGIVEALDGASAETTAELLALHPRALQRPIVLADDGRAVIGRPPEAVQSLLP